ncbi:ribosome silencing factor [Bartonella clarridgeiae]|uniref:ribosome silencing factor n=1 Tax=Bartonella clarridgeiae TaxID=56426 RepID=UPI0002DC5D32|nr:ribosome silencing factor [Bartonella clarridgeiae]WCR54645.1 MAG: Ribosomal silencing factor RsfA [Bartonella clarridgeiae]
MLQIIRKDINLEKFVQKRCDIIANLVEEKCLSVTHGLKIILGSLENIKAEDIISIDLQGRSSLADYMVIASGCSQRHVSAITDYLLHVWKDSGYGKARVEGMAGGDWVLIDTGDIIIHLFRPEIRNFYNLEKMWLDSSWDNIESIFVGDN